MAMSDDRWVRRDPLRALNDVLDACVCGAVERVEARNRLPIYKRYESLFTGGLFNGGTFGQVKKAWMKSSVVIVGREQNDEAIAAFYRRQARVLAYKRTIHPQLRAFIMKPGAICVYCRKNIATQVDHVVPRAQGGGNEASNLVPACQRCNLMKGGRTPEEWMASLDKARQSTYERYKAERKKLEHIALLQR